MTKDSDHAVQKNLKLGLQIVDYCNQFELKMKHLQQLFEGLEGIQKDLISLSVEVWGKETIINDQDNSGEMMKLIGMAQTVHNEEASLLNELDTNLAGVRKKIEDLSNKSLAESQQQLEVQLFARATTWILTSISESSTWKKQQYESVQEGYEESRRLLEIVASFPLIVLRTLST